MRRQNVLRLVCVVLVAYEARSALASGVAGAHAVLDGRMSHIGAGSVMLIAVLALLAGLAIREMGRDLPLSRGWLRRSLDLTGLWLIGSSTLLALLWGADALGVDSHSSVLHLVREGCGWAVASFAACGLLAAVTCGGGRWVARVIAGASPRYRGLWPKPPRLRYLASLEPFPAAAPLLGGWSDRGPPTRP